MGKPHCPAQHHKSGAVSNRQLTRLVRKKGSDHCHGCRRPYRHRDLSHIGYDAAGRLLVVGECCTDRLKSITGISVYLAHDAATPWAEDDCMWFEAHPDRSHRLRRAYPEEFPEKVEHAVVRQLAPGQRYRIGLTVPPALPQDEAPEAAAWAIFDVVAESIQKDCEATTTEIFARWAMLENEARV
jgi:hypothetical protein